MAGGGVLLTVPATPPPLYPTLSATANGGSPTNVEHTLWGREATEMHSNSNAGKVKAGPECGAANGSA